MFLHTFPAQLFPSFIQVAASGDASPSCNSDEVPHPQISKGKLRNDLGSLQHCTTIEKVQFQDVDSHWRKMAFHLITEYSAALLGIPFLACFWVAWKPEVAWRGVINSPPAVFHKKTSSTDHPYERRIPRPKRKTFSFNTFQLPTIFNLHFPPYKIPHHRPLEEIAAFRPGYQTKLPSGANG